MNKKLTYISLFSGAGIGCFGFKQNDFECIATSEILKKRLDIQKYNNKCRYETGYIEGDITHEDVKIKIFDEIRKWKDQCGTCEIDVLIATPPCQGMSVANHKKRKEIGRNSLVIESIKMTQVIKPKFFIFENVRTFLNTICSDTDGNEKPIKDSILLNLGGTYNILCKIINFKDYGANSSRTRTLIIGVRKDLKYVSPFDIFPKKQPSKKLRELFVGLDTLSEMGQISHDDVFHSFRSYNPKMLAWIENLQEGESAFQNTDPQRIPHQIKDGKIIINAHKNSDKYSRWYLDREGPCIHTRNDILASQNTIHPTENRVFSIRELMLMMSIPANFRWTEHPHETLEKLSLPQKQAFLKKEELNIRHCIGEAVPTGVFENIAQNIKQTLSRKILTTREINDLIKNQNLYKTENLVSFINSFLKEQQEHRIFSMEKCLHPTELPQDFLENLDLRNIFQIAEFANSSRQDNAAFFTREDIAFSVVKDLPEFKGKKKISILEPAVGIGNFIPLLMHKYEDKEEVTFDLFDIDKNVFLVLERILTLLKIPEKFKFNFFNEDFLTYSFDKKYDLVVGNPPYGKLTKTHKKSSLYKKEAINKKTNNLFAFFIEKAISLGRYVSFIVPKSLTSSPEFNKTREILQSKNLLKICDYGEKGFKNVKIETISFLLDTASKQRAETIIVESYITENIYEHQKDYVFSSLFPYWLLYRNQEFDKVCEKMELGVFQTFRDRQITKNIIKGNGKYRVLKSRNISNNKIIDVKNYDAYIDDISNLSVAKFVNTKKTIAVPNLTYYPRASFLPENAIADGSVALLALKNGSRQPTEKDLDYFASKEFEKFYRIARNYGTRSLNIDNNSVFFFGMLKNSE